jgi:hypothetical protein
MREAAGLFAMNANDSMISGTVKGNVRHQIGVDG